MEHSKTMIIIGGGIAGLATGCFAQMNGYRTRIFEMHSLPGGQCTAWKRKGYTFDGCIHHLAGCTPRSRLYPLWQELGAVPRPILHPADLVRVEDAAGKAFTLYADIDRLEQHMNHLSPADAGVTQEYTRAARQFTRFDLMDLAIATRSDLPHMLPNLLVALKWFGASLAHFATRFADPFLRRAFPLVQYGNPDLPMALHLNILAGCHTGEHGWPARGSLEFARSIARRYHDLGGEIHYQARVVKILVDDDRAAGVRLAGGREHRAGTVVSTIYGPTTIFGLLDGQYANKQIRAHYATPADQIEMGVHVSLGVARDLSPEAHAIVLLLEHPVKLAGQLRDRLDLSLFGFDPSMAPPGKGVLKVELPASYTYWQELYQDRTRYREEKQRLAETVIDLLEPRFPGLRHQVEVIDVATPMTTERYTGNAHGFENSLGQIMRSMLPGGGLSRTLPGLKNFYMVGQWAGTPGLPNVSGMARSVVRSICRQDGRAFATAVPRQTGPARAAEV